MAFTLSDQLPIVIAVLLVNLTFFVFKRFLKTTPAKPLPPPTEITKLFIYPIKSCHGIEVTSAKLLPTGLDLDRQWMWVSYPTHEFLTIRNNARMTLIRPTYDAKTDALTVTAPAPNAMDEKLQFSIPAHPSPSWLSQNTEPGTAKIWGKDTSAHVFSAPLTAPFNDFFGQEVRLVYKSPTSDSPRPLGSNGAPKYLGREASTCFPDLMPILVGCESSIEELNERVKKAEDVAIDVTRFRPNILVRGHEPWSEDSWKTLSISPTITGNNIHLDVTQRCARCRVPNVDPDTAEEHKRQPWDTLMKYRRIDEGMKYKPCFGMLCVPRGEGGKVAVGMKMRVTQVTDGHRYIAGF